MTDVITNPYATNQNLNNREEIISHYLQMDIKEGKSFICRYYRRGCCLFSKDECKFAHCIEDIIFKKLNYEAFLNHSNTNMSSSEYANNNQEDEEDKKDQLKQPSLRLEINYRDLYNYQFILLEKKLVTEIIPQEVLNKEKTLRKEIRVIFHRDLQRQFFEYFLQRYSCKYMNKTFLEKCFNSIGWMAHWKEILHPTFAYEVKAKGLGNIIVRQMSSEELDNFMEDSIVKIIKDNHLMDKLSISPAIITKLYYQNILKNNETLPTFSMYLKARSLNSTDDYLRVLQNKESFIEKLSKAHEKDADEFKSLAIFTQTAQEMEDLFNKIRSILHLLINGSGIGLILYSEYEKAVMDQCKQELHQFNNNLPQIKKFMTRVAIEEGTIPMNLVTDVYLLSPSKFESTDLSRMYHNCQWEINHSCSLASTDHIALHNFKHLRHEKLNAHIPDRQSEEFLAEEIDMSKIVVVDSLETLELAQEHLRSVNSIAVDLEGALCVGGRIELVQCGTNTKIFVFDIFGVLQLAKTNKEIVPLYNGMANLLRETMENNKICKVFHDGRRDSLALHLFLDACPSNVFDLSAIHILIDQLENMKVKISKMSLNKANQSNQNTKLKFDELAKNPLIDSKLSLNLIEEPRLPGLNDVLGAYEASHGLNRFKMIMKKRFNSVPAEYFLQRPIDIEHLIYSSKDVEDLIEVRDKMKLKLKQALGYFINNIEDEKIDLLCSKASKTFATFGCHNMESKES